MMARQRRGTASPRSLREGFWDSFLGLAVAHFWGWNLKPSTDDHEDGLGQAATLLGIFVVWQAALLAYIQRDPNPQLRVFWTYVGFSLVPLIGMFNISIETMVKAYHRRIVWRLSVLSVVTMALMATSYYYRLLPGQFETGTYPDANTEYRGVYIERDIESDVPTTWRASLNRDAAKYWRVQNVKCFSDEARENEVADFRRDSSKTTDDELVGNFLAHVSRKYFFTVQLEEVAKEPSDRTFSTDDVNFEINTVRER